MQNNPNPYALTLGVQIHNRQGFVFLLSLLLFAALFFGFCCWIAATNKRNAPCGSALGHPAVENAPRSSALGHPDFEYAPCGSQPDIEDAPCGSPLGQRGFSTRERARAADFEDAHGSTVWQPSSQDLLSASTFGQPDFEDAASGSAIRRKHQPITWTSSGSCRSPLRTLG